MKKSAYYLIPLILTLGLITWSIWFFFKHELGPMAQIGDFISGIAATLAFLWLVFGYYLQIRELQLQRDELHQQREALALQAKELRRIGEFNALQQISRIMTDFGDSLRSRALPDSTTVFKLPMAHIMAMTDFFRATDGLEDQRKILEAYSEWLPIHTACEQFIDTVVMAIWLYTDPTKKKRHLECEDAANLIVACKDLMADIPFLHQYASTAYALASHFVDTKPGIRRLRLMGLDAMNTLYANTVKHDELEKLRKQVADHDREVDRSQQSSD